MNANKTDRPVKLDNVRISYPHLFQKSVFEGKVGKYECTFMIPKEGDPNLARLKQKLQEITSSLSFKVSPERMALKDGDATGKEEYTGHYILKASTNRKPMVINRDKTPLTEEDGVIYGGCFVNATVDFWVQNNQFGKRINCNLRAVQFAKDGDPFGMGPVDDELEFDTIDGGSDFDDDLPF